MSSEHLVFYGKLEFDIDEQRKISYNVIVKYHLIKDDKGNLYVQNMIKKHADPILKNYNRLDNYLEKFSDINNKIEVVSVMIVKCKQGGWFGYFKNEINLWVEKKIENFTKFYHSNPECHHQKIATTDNKDLQKLQDFIYEQSNERYTVCDL